MNRSSYRYISTIYLLIGALVILRLTYIQIFRHNFFSAQASRNIYKFEYLDSPRGLILDTNGKVIVGNHISFCGGAQIPFSKRISIREKALSDYVDKIKMYLGVTSDQILVRKKELIVEVCDLSLTQSLKLLELRVNDRNYYLRVRYSRTSEFGEEMGHIIGYMSNQNRTPFGEVISSGLSGKTGIERCADEFLRGTEGIARLTLNVRAEKVSSNIIRKPKPGLNVLLSINSKWQTRAYEILGENRGAVVVLEANTGFIRALVSKPGFNSNVFNLRLKDKINDILSNPDKPLIFRALNGTYPPGSITKPLVILGLKTLELKTAYCPGFDVVDRVRIHCHQRTGHGHVSVSDAIIKSCDVYFYKLSRTITFDEIIKLYKMFNFGDTTQITCFQDSKGVLIPRERIKHSINLEKALLLIGQGTIAVTPLQVAVAYASIINGGKILKPKIIERIYSKTGEFDYHVKPTVLKKLNFDSERLTIIFEALFRVVNSPQGTAYGARSSVMQFSGKTGTAQVVSLRKKSKEKNHEHHAWFAGFWPSENPKYVIVVLVENGGSGGKVAAPIARDLIEFITQDEAG